MGVPYHPIFGNSHVSVGLFVRKYSATFSRQDHKFNLLVQLWGAMGLLQSKPRPGTPNLPTEAL